MSRAEPATGAEPATRSGDPGHRYPRLVHLRAGRLTNEGDTPAVQARRLAPFAVAWLLSIVAPLLIGDHYDLAMLGGAAVVSLVAAFMVVRGRQSASPVAGLVPVLIACTSVLLLREATGGAARGYGSVLVLLPVVWQGLYGRRSDVVLAVAAAVACLALPVVAFEGYPAATEVPRLVTTGFVAVVVGMLLQALASSRRSNEAALAQLGDFSRALNGADEPRPLLVQLVLRLTGASGVLLFEPHPGRGELVLTAATGAPEGTSPGEAATGGPSRVTASGVVEFEATGPADTPVVGLRPGARLHAPVGDPAAPVGALTAVWEGRRRPPSPLVLGMLSVLGADAALAIARADLVARLATEAQRDGLTGLPNRRSWDDALALEVARADRTGRPLSLAIIDLDHFKAYNDRHGHLAGDDLLASAARSWRSRLRQHDVLARWGGEEFSLLFPETTVESARTVLDRLAEATPGGQTFSAGLAAHLPGRSPESLVDRADTAMYAAKAAGRNRVSVADPPDDAPPDGSLNR